MKHLIKTIGLALAIAFSTTTAQAMDIKPYIGVGVGAFTLSSVNTTHFSYQGQVGVDIGDLFGLELRYGQTTESEYVDAISTTKIKASYFSYLAKIRGQTSNLEFYGLIGGTSGQVKQAISTPNVIFVATGTPNLKTTENSFSAGAGVDYKIQDALSIGVEYMHYFKDANGYTANFKYSF